MVEEKNKEALSDNSISLFPSTEYLCQSISLSPTLPQAQVTRQNSVSQARANKAYQLLSNSPSV